MLEEDSQLIKRLCFQLSSQIKYSVSGNSSNGIVPRKGISDYLPVNTDHLQNVFRTLRKQVEYLIDPIPPFSLMLKESVGDCAEQALFLAMLMKQLEKLNKNLQFFLCDIPLHTFIVLLDREQQNLLPPHGEIPGYTLINEAISIIDPFNNEYYTSTDLAAGNTPFSTWAPNVDFEKSNFSVQNFDHCYLDAQRNFKNYSERLKGTLFEKISLIKNNANREKLCNYLAENKLELLLRTVATAPSYFSILNFLVENANFLSLDLNARGLNSGTALDCAEKSKNLKAICLLRPYNFYPSISPPSPITRPVTDFFAPVASSSDIPEGSLWNLWSCKII